MGIFASRTDALSRAHDGARLDGRMEWVPSTADAVEQFLADDELAGRTIAALRSRRSYLKPIAELGVPLRDVTPAHVGDVLRARVRQNARTAATVYSVLNVFFTYCLERHWIDVSPLAHVPKPRYQQKRHRYLQVDELRRLWAAAQDDETRLTLQLLLLGLRANELVSLRWQDVDFDHRLIRVMFAKGGRPRVVAMGADLEQLLRARPRTGRRVLGFTDDTLRLRLAKLGERAGVPGVHPHLFRHTFAVAWLRETSDAETLQTLGGWRDPTMVRYYARSVLEEVAVEKARQVDLAGRLFGQ